MTKIDLVKILSEKMGWALKESTEIVEQVFDIMKETLEGGEKVKIPGFGNFNIRAKRPRKGRNPKTGEKLNDWYEMRQIMEEKEIELFSKFIVRTDTEKSVYDMIPCDSEVEKKFVEDLEARTDVRLYLKLPYWFLVPTPVGDYRPDWAIVMDDPESEGKPILYLVSETKGSTRKDDLRPDEWRKIQCGAAHFGSTQYGKKGALQGVDYKVVTKASDLP